MVSAFLLHGNRDYRRITVVAQSKYAWPAAGQRTTERAIRHCRILDAIETRHGR